MRESPTTGTWALFRIGLLTGRWPLAATTIVLPGLVLATAQGVRDLYPTPEARDVYAVTMGGSPTSMAFNGKAYDLTTLCGITVAEVGFLGFLAIPIAAVFLAVYFTRRQEDNGRVELLTAAPVGRMAPLCGGLAVTATGAVVAGLLHVAALVMSDLSVTGSLVYGLALTLYFITFVGVGAVAAQVAQSARGALGMGFAVVGICFLARAVVDGRALDLPWLTPMSWLSEVRPYGPRQGWPLLAFVALAAALFVLAAWLCERRDLGAGMVAPRRGPAMASSYLRGAIGLTRRLTLPTGLVWLAGAAVWGFTLGLLSNETRKMLDANPALAQALGTAGDASEAFLAVAVVLVALLAVCCGVQAIVRLAGEESAGRLGLVLSGPQSRARWWLVGWGSAVVLAAGTLVTGAVAVGLGARLAGGDDQILATALTSGRDYLPGVLVTITLSTVAWAMSAKLASLGWVLVGWEVVVAMLAETLQLAQWARDVSPLHLIGRMPVEPGSGAVMSGELLVTMCLVVVGTLGFRARSLASG